MVVAHHAEQGVSSFVAKPPELISTVLEFGYLGVDFFFVLSGFIIYYTACSRERTPAYFSIFLTKRVFRIFVPYLPVAVALALTYTIFPGLSASDRIWSWWPTLFLIPSFDPPSLSVAWTLQHEIFFYFLFSVLILFNRIITGMVIWAIAIVVAQLFFGIDSGPMAILVSWMNLEFLFGIVAAHIILTKEKSNNYLFVAGSLCALVAFASLGFARDYSPVFGLAVAFAIVPICRLETKKPAAFNIGVLLFLGNASYSVYLVHNPMISVLSRVAAYFDFGSNWFIPIVFVSALSVVAGLIYYLMWEKPALALSQKRIWPRLFEPKTSGSRPFIGADQEARVRT